MTKLLENESSSVVSMSNRPSNQLGVNHQTNLKITIMNRIIAVRNAITYLLLALSTSVAVQAQGIYVKAGSVDLAQTHVLNADGLLGPNAGVQPELVGDRAVLFKVNFLSDTPNVSVDRVSAKVTIRNASTAVGGVSLDLIAPAGPSNLPLTFDNTPSGTVHSFENSYYVLIPPNLIKPGFKWSLSWNVLSETGMVLDKHSMKRTELVVTPPNKMIMNTLTIDWFAPSGNTPILSPDLVGEMEQKLPISELILRESPPAVFTKIAMPYKNLTTPAAIVSSAAQLRSGWGDVDVDRSKGWARILQRASGVNYYEHANFCVINRGENVGGGIGADGYYCVSNDDPGTFWHELGHTFQLPHWGESGPRADLYPYKNEAEYLGLSATKGFNSAHAGPYWAYDARSVDNGVSSRGIFIAPWLDVDLDGTPDRWKRSPLQGGGSVDSGSQQLAHFSDYSINKIMSILDDRSYWFERDNEWIDDAKWAAHGPGWYFSNPQHSYQPYTGDGRNRPVANDQEVFSIMLAGSMAKDNQFGHVYPAIGPYIANLRTMYDPRDPAAMAELSGSSNCPAAGCDLSVRVVQGGVTNVFTIEQSWNENIPKTNQGAFFEQAINVPMSFGAITSIELLLTPDAQTYSDAGAFDENMTVLAQWPYIE